MFKFSDKSQEFLKFADGKLVLLTNEVIKISEVDFSIICSVRSVEKQQEAFKNGSSKCDGIKIKSKHQPNDFGLSEAIDIMCYNPKTKNATWENKYYYYIAGLFRSKASELGINFRWGGWFDFEDAGHFEV